MNRDMYGRSELEEIVAYALPQQPDLAGYQPDAAAELDGTLYCALTVRGETSRAVLFAFRDGAIVGTFPMKAPAIAIAAHRGRLVVLTLELDVLALDGDTFRALGPATQTPARVGGDTADIFMRTEAAWCITTDNDELEIDYLWCGAQRVFARFRESAGWGNLAPLDARAPVSLARRRGTLLATSTGPDELASIRQMHAYDATESTWKPLAPRLRFAYSKGARKLVQAVRLRNDERGQVLGQMEFDTFVRLDDKDVFEWPDAKWQTPFTYAELVRSTGWSFFVVEQRDSVPSLVEKRAALDFAPNERSLASKGSKPRKLVFAPKRFFDATLLARECHLLGTRFLSDDRLLVLGSTKTSLVVHDFVFRDQQWTHQRRHAVALTMKHETDGFGVHYPYDVTIHTDGTKTIIAFCGREQQQCVRFDAVTNELEALELHGDGYLCGLIDGALIVTAVPGATAPVTFVRAGEAPVRTSKSFKGGYVATSAEHVYVQDELAAYAIDPRTAAIARTWVLPTEDMFFEIDGQRVVARRDVDGITHRHELRWDDAEPRALAPKPRQSDPWKFAGYTVTSNLPTPTTLSDRDGVPRFMLDFNSASRRVYMLEASPNNRFWTAGDIYNFEILEHAPPVLQLAPRAPDASAEERCELLYPGFLSSQRARPLIAKWPLAVAIYENLVEHKLADEFSLESFAAVFSKRIDTERMALVRDAVRCVQHLAESHPRVRELTRLTHEVNGNAIHLELYPQWDGEDDTFCVFDLRGIELCEGLEEITMHLGSYDGPAVDVRPLCKLPRLAKAELRGTLAHIDSLVTMKTLKHLRVDALPPPSVLAAFESAGATVERAR